MKITNIGVKVHFWPDFKKVKKWILLDIFSRKGPMTLKMCGKKTYDPSGFSPEIFFYLNKNWQKYWQLESCHFFFDHTVQIRSSQKVFTHHNNSFQTLLNCDILKLHWIWRLWTKLSFSYLYKVTWIDCNDFFFNKLIYIDV